jgi:hypothetical protein
LQRPRQVSLCVRRFKVLPSYDESAVNPYQSPIDEVTLRTATHCVKKRPAGLAWITVILPPLAMLAAIGLGAYVDSLTLGPGGFSFVLILIGPGAWAIASTCAYGVVEFLSHGSLATRVTLWILEIAVCLFTYSLVFPGPGWG